MQRKRWLMTAGCMAAMLVALPALSQEQPPEPTQQEPAQQEPAQQADESRDATTVRRAENVVDLTVYTADNVEVGEVEDLVVGMGQGDIRYAALELEDEFWNIGDKLVAVPMQALKLMQSTEGNDYLEISLSQEELQQAQTFDTKWPTTADAKLTETVGQQAQPAGDSASQPAFRVETITDMDVYDGRERELGEIEDLVVDLDKGQVRYAALEFEEGFLGLQEKFFAIPWDQFEVKQEGDQQWLVLNVSEAKLKDAPGFDKDNWPRVADTAWQGQIDEYYQTDEQ